jgi:hypothetical protein
MGIKKVWMERMIGEKLGKTWSSDNMVRTPIQLDAGSRPCRRLPTSDSGETKVCSSRDSQAATTVATDEHRVATEAQDANHCAGHTVVGRLRTHHPLSPQIHRHLPL